MADGFSKPENTHYNSLKTIIYNLVCSDPTKIAYYDDL